MKTTKNITYEAKMWDNPNKYMVRDGVHNTKATSQYFAKKQMARISPQSVVVGGVVFLRASLTLSEASRNTEEVTESSMILTVHHNQHVSMHNFLRVAMFAEISYSSEMLYLWLQSKIKFSLRQK